MSTIIKNRNGEIISSNETQDKWLRFLYRNFFGRLILKLLVCRFVSKIVGWYMNSRLSTRMIKGFVEKNKIDMTQYENKEWRSYNEFFTRKLAQGARKIDYDNDSFISPCDSKLTVHPINADSVFYIKNSVYTVSDLLAGAKVAQEYEGGYCLIFRLCVDDYHRYCYFDSGKKTMNIFVKGKLHTVNPIALDNCNIYARNCREYTVMQTENFGKVIQTEVGAMCVGKIKNWHEEHSFSRGEEKGMFEFGGSTIVLLVKKDVIKVDDDILSNSGEGIETVVKMGEKIGKKICVNLPQTE
ncbi:MAG: phosphatidylserine decarboxylase [Clostridia bacterium]|nr:phosphatidylserine decarboxylase [Clostridia bacterium]